MSERTGLGPIEVALLKSSGLLNARTDRPYVKCKRIVDRVSTDFRIGQSYAYNALCDLSRDWKVPLPLFDGHGDLGDIKDPAANPAYTEARLSAVGMLALSCERGEFSPLPLRLINGTHYFGGDAPALDPAPLLQTLITLIEEPSMSDADVYARVQLYNLNGATVHGDIRSLMRGEEVILTWRARINRLGDDLIEVSQFPAMLNYMALVDDLSNDTDDGLWATYEGEDLGYEQPSRSRLPIQTVDSSESRIGPRRQPNVQLHLRDGADVSATILSLVDHPMVSTQEVVGFPASVPQMLRAWVDEHQAPGLADGLKLLLKAL